MQRLFEKVRDHVLVAGAFGFCAGLTAGPEAGLAAATLVLLVLFWRRDDPGFQS
jgi:hypothetical protein